ncbi:microtubule-associated protein 9 [Anarhichas minor]|uniref:microtubule-associated protein 9 n=1 Tax=Anarhichas minor TaxID=65739 RepID=UPI003F73998E
MTNQQFRTLAYTKSPKTSRRTTFQDELQAAVSARASKAETDRYSYSDDFSDDEDDFLNELLKSSKKRAGAIKAAKSQPKLNDFDISDDEGKRGRTKRVSFLKTQRVVSPPDDAAAPESRENEPPDSSTGPHSNHGDSTNIGDDNVPFESSDAVSAYPQITRRSSSKSLSYQTSDDSLLDMPLPLPSDNSGAETPGPEKKSTSALEDGSHTPLSATDLTRVSSADTNREPPRPKPRQRTLGLSLHAAEKMAEDAGSPDLSRPQTSSASIPLSPDTSSNTAWKEGSQAVSCGLSKSSSSKSEQSQLFTKTTVDSGSRDGFISDDSKERKYSTSFEEFNADSGEHSQQLSRVHHKSFDTRTWSSPSEAAQRSHSVCAGKVESRYLGTLKLLDRKVSLQDSQLPAADSLRAAIYQQWLRKKKEKSRENMQIQKKEEILKEKKKREEEAKKEDAVASYEAWKETKAESLKAKAKEKQDAIRKVQRAVEEKEEKTQSAQQVFDKWKSEHDHRLKEKSRRQREAENKLQFRKQEKEKERKRDSKSAVSDWREKKTVVLHEKVLTVREETQNKAEEERYVKEERDQMALEMYENWLVRKDLEQKRQREERRIQAILQDGPPPPWSPPNKTIPFGK